MFDFGTRLNREFSYSVNMWKFIVLVVFPFDLETQKFICLSFGSTGGPLVPTDSIYSRIFPRFFDYLEIDSVPIFRLSLVPLGFFFRVFATEPFLKVLTDHSRHFQITKCWIYSYTLLSGRFVRIISLSILIKVPSSSFIIEALPFRFLESSGCFQVISCVVSTGNSSLRRLRGFQLGIFLRTSKLASLEVFRSDSR